MRAVVETDIHTLLGTAVQQAAALRIGADYAGEMLRRDALGDLAPRFSVVGSVKQVRPVVARLV